MDRYRSAESGSRQRGRLIWITDISEGDGEVAEAGNTVKVHYVGVAYSTGEEFDASLEPRRPAGIPARCRPGHRRLGSGCSGHAGRQPPVS